MDSAKTIAAGILPFSSNGKLILLGQEYRKNYDAYYWMEFGGKQEPGQTLAQTAWREALEETAGTLTITLEQVEEAERKGHYIDNYNERSGVYYRMYCVKMNEIPDPEIIKANAPGKKDVEKINWQYFNAEDVIYNVDGVLPGDNNILYSTMRTRLEKLRNASFLASFFR